MIICCSPTKTMKSMSKYESTEPYFLEEVEQLVALMRDKQVDDLMKFYKCNEKIAAQNKARWQSFDLHAENNAGLCFDGLQFKRMQMLDWSIDEWQYAQEHLMIMSGLYGMLRVKDGISEYRLDVENPLMVDGMKLTEFWQPKICNLLKDEIIIDCCSKEYSALLPENKISIYFYVEKQGKLKVEATAAKMARGSFINYCVMHKVNNVSAMYAFSEMGFKLCEDLSDNHKLVFVRGEES